MDNIQEIGLLKTYDPIKGYGFIQRKQGKDVFVRYADFQAKDADASALVGSKLKFNIQATPRGPRATNVEVIS